MRLDPKKLRTVMAAKSVTVSDLARLSRMPASKIGWLLSGDLSDPSLQTLERLAKALGCTLEEILMPLDPRKLRTMMAVRSVTVCDLARRMEMPPSNISRLLSGNFANPRLDTLERLAKALGCTVLSLIS